MKRVQYVVFSILLLSCCMFSQAQQSVATNTSGVVPTLVKFSGTLTDINGKPLIGTVGVTFMLYKDDQGGAPLWMETQNVTPDKSGHYTVVLGSTTAPGLPTDLFASGEARWLGVQAQGQAEQPRVLLLSVPYALKAGDAQTVGGLPASAFVLAAPPNAATASASANPASATALAVTPLASSDVTTTGGTTDTIPMFTTATNVQNSILTQTGTTAINVGGKLNLPATGAATTAAGKNSQPQDFVASSYNSSSKAAVGQTFQLQAEPAGNDTATPSGTLNLLYGSGTATPAETGLKISSGGLLTFATGQTFPGAGKGTITGVTAGTALTGGGTTGTVTLNVDTTKIPQLSVANTFTGNQTIKGNLSDTGNITATGSITSQTADFTANNNTQVLKITQNGAGIGLNSTAAGGTGVTGTGSIGVNGLGTGSSGVGVQAGSSSGVGVFSSTATGVAIFAIAGTPNGVGSIEGYANSTATGASTPGVTGYSTTEFGVGTKGLWSTSSTVGSSTSQVGVWGDSSNGDGVHGTSDSGLGVLGQSTNFHGVAGFSGSPSAAGVAATNTNGGYGVYATTTAGGIAGYFQGNLQTTGLITTYNGLPTYGNGVPSIVAELFFYSGGSGNTTPQTLFTPTNDGVFRITMLQECLGTSSPGGIFTTYFTWTLPTGAGGNVTVQDGSCSSLNQNQWGTVVAHVQGGTPIQFTYSGMFVPFQTTMLVEQLL